MFLKTKTKLSTSSSLDKIGELHAALEGADAVLIGAGAGLSTAAGFTYAGSRFERYFSDFIATYGFMDMYSAGFYPYKTLEEHWAYWSRYIYINRYMDAPKETYSTLLRLVANKDYFVLTTNVDHQFQKAGFDKHRLFYTQGDYGLWQCSVPCHQATYENEAVVRQMVEAQCDMRVPSELVPRCPVCGAPMTMNLRADHTFVEDEGWHRAAERYQHFLRRHQGLKVLYLELGVGGNTPGIIKYPFWQMVDQNPRAIYGCINLKEAFAPREIEDRSICIEGDIDTVLSVMADNRSVEKQTA